MRAPWEDTTPTGIERDSAALMLQPATRNVMKDTMSPEEVRALVDKLLMEFGLPVDETAREPVVQKQEGALERHSGSRLDPAGRAKKP